MKSNATYEILQFYSTWKTTIPLTKQMTGFYSIHISQLWYWDNTTRIFVTSTANEKKLFRINTSSQIKPKGIAGSKQKDSSTINKSSRLHKSQVNTEEQLQAAKQRFHHNRCKNMPTIFFTKAMRSSQAFTHARMRSCTTHHLHVWEHV